MSYLGDFRLGDTLDFHFTTRQISGAPFTLGGTPVISAYPANSTTELTAGITLDVDFDSRTGLNHVRVVVSNGNGYATATDYSLVITTGTVNSVSVVGEVIGNFSIEHRSALMPATAARTLVVDAAGLADANMVKAGASGAGNAITTSGGVTLPAATLASTTNITAGTITTVTTTTTATNLTNAPTNGDFTATMKTSIGTAVAASAVASVTGNVGGNVTGSVGSVVGLTPANLDVAVSSRMATYTQPTGFLAASFPSAVGDATAASQVTINNNVIAVPGNTWDVTLASHLTPGSTGAALNAAGSAGDPWQTALPGAYTAGQAGYIIGHNIDATISSRLATSALGFSVPGYVDVNISYVNGTKVNGSGTGGSPWGP